MHASDRTQTSKLKAAIAIAIAMVMVGGAAIVYSTASEQPVERMDFIESELPQGSRHPMPGDKYTPGRQSQQVIPPPIAAFPAPCQGEGLVDPANVGTSTGVGSLREHCRSGILILGEQDMGNDAPASGQLYPEGDGPVDPVNDY